MKKRPNVLWLMSDQHNANCTAYAGNPNVKTPNLDQLANSGVWFSQAFCNNPICSPSRITFMTGKYIKNHQLAGNNHKRFPADDNPNTLAGLFRRYGYQTALVGKSHMVQSWDKANFEHLAYTDLCDADLDNPLTCHYFKYLVDHNLADYYEEGYPKINQPYNDGSAPSTLPYEHSIEHFTGNESLKFLKNRDESRPFFLKMSFQRPHDPITPAPEDFDMYNPEEIELPDSSVDFLENSFAGKPEFMQEQLNNGSTYPLATKDKAVLKRALASYYALITKIDKEIGRVFDYLKEIGEYENTVIFYTADHGDFAGEHGLTLKNLGIYESIHKIPFLLKWPNSPQGVTIDKLVEAVDWYPTLCEICNVPVNKECDGTSLVELAKGKAEGKEQVFCEWSWKNDQRIGAVRTSQYRLVYYDSLTNGELYDRDVDPGEINNLWGDSRYSEVKFTLMQKLLNYYMSYHLRTGSKTDSSFGNSNRYAFSALLQKYGCYYSDLMKVYTTLSTWPPNPKE